MSRASEISKTMKVSAPFIYLCHIRIKDAINVSHYEETPRCFALYISRISNMKQIPKNTNKLHLTITPHPRLQPLPLWSSRAWLQVVCRKEIRFSQSVSFGLRVTWSQIIQPLIRSSINCMREKHLMGEEITRCGPRGGEYQRRERACQILSQLVGHTLNRCLYIWLISNFIIVSRWLQNRFSIIYFELISD